VTVRVVRRVVFPILFVVLLKLMVPTYLLGIRFLALELIEKVTVVPDFVARPDVDEAVSQVGTLVIEYLTNPPEAASVYLNVDGENGPP
jgi:hypothetical protein